MSSLTALERRQFEDLLSMAGGYVLSFTDRSFAEFFRKDVGVDLNAAKYNISGDSKAKRLRAFWDIESDELVGKALKGLLEYWKYEHPQLSTIDKEHVENCHKIVERLLGRLIAQGTLEDQFLGSDFGTVSFDEIGIDSSILPILKSRFAEAMQCLNNGAPLAATIVCGSILEGLLLGQALAYPQQFNQALCSPKDGSGKVRQFQDWKLAQLIDAAHELGYLKLDVKEYSHVLRDFRNYIHPYEQMSSHFDPDEHTARICIQVLKAAIADLSGKRS